MSGSGRLALQDFLDRLDDDFEVAVSKDLNMTLRLIAANSLVSNNVQENFDLFFRGPLESLLPQSIYSFNHPTLGRNEIFIVPVEQRTDGFIYQAVFNYIVQKPAEAAA